MIVVLLGGLIDMGEFPKWLDRKQVLHLITGLVHVLLFSVERGLISATILANYLC